MVRWVGKEVRRERRAARRTWPSRVRAARAGSAPILVLVLGACAGATSGWSPTKTHQIGRGTHHAILRSVPTVLNRFGYPVVDLRETPRSMIFETSWIHREPFPDEAAGGAEVVRTRITVEARRAAGHNYSVRLRVSSAALGPAADGEWEEIAATRTLDEHVRRIGTAIKDEIDAGVRVF